MEADKEYPVDDLFVATKARDYTSVWSKSTGRRETKQLAYRHQANQPNVPIPKTPKKFQLCGLPSVPRLQKRMGETGTRSCDFLNISSILMISTISTFVSQYSWCRVHLVCSPSCFKSTAERNNSRGNIASITSS